jgi:hypothetical protein
MPRSSAVRRGADPGVARAQHEHARVLRREKLRDRLDRHAPRDHRHRRKSGKPPCASRTISNAIAVACALGERARALGLARKLVEAENRAMRLQVAEILGQHLLHFDDEVAGPDLRCSAVERTPLEVLVVVAADPGAAWS